MYDNVSSPNRGKTAIFYFYSKKKKNIPHVDDEMTNYIRLGSW